MYVYACISRNDTRRHWNRCHVPEKHSPWAAIGGPHSGTPGQLGIHFFQPSAKVVKTRFGAPHPAARVLAPEAPLLFRTEVSNARSAHYNPVPWRATADLAGSSPSDSIQMPEGVGSTPSKPPLDSDSLMYVYVRIYTYIRI